MGILDFFERSVGKWFSQRTSYQLAQPEQWHQSDKTNLFHELLPAEALEVVQLCDRCHVDAKLALGGLKTRWEKTSFKPAGHVLLVPLEASNQLDNGEITGSILRSNPDDLAITGHYGWGSDDTLVIVTETGGSRHEERLWFAAENLRLRTILITNSQDDRQFSSFYSEIRMGGAPPAPAK